MARAIAHTGRILIDLIPHVYTKDRIARVLARTARRHRCRSASPSRSRTMTASQPATRIYDLGVGKYDLTVTAGPSFATRREEAASR
jgi:hypothetical protein